MRVRIDYDLCTGHGRCYTLAPGVFGCDDSGFGQVLADGKVEAGLVREAKLAEGNCPERAVIVVE
ncbi:MAG TPA: ferredoxin [Acidimicrobiales bacterium]